MKRLLVPNNITTFFNVGRSIDRFMAHWNTFSTESPPIPEFNAFNGVKYFCHNLKYPQRPAIMESPSNKVFVTVCRQMKCLYTVSNT